MRDITWEEYSKYKIKSMINNIAIIGSISKCEVREILRKTAIYKKMVGVNIPCLYDSTAKSLYDCKEEIEEISKGKVIITDSSLSRAQNIIRSSNIRKRSEYTLGAALPALKEKIEFTGEENNKPRGEIQDTWKINKQSTTTGRIKVNRKQG